MLFRSIVDGKAVLNALTSLGLLIRPRETRVKLGQNFKISLHANYNYTPEDFFQEHQEFMDSFAGDGLEHYEN